jgi:hypothetical protein
MRQTCYIVVLACVLGLGTLGCGSGSVDYTKVAAQTGGLEQGVWQDKGGQKLELTSGTFTYSKPDGTLVKGTYKVNAGTIAMTGSSGEAMTAAYDPKGTMSINGSALTKTD